uniref:Aminotransferase class V domain-containing protein n=1 Tax=Dunaliella tertiolecta TaxID=3047 RepID=A0A7S3VH55_DUNTE|mmetsp:Transcript_20180/g.56206  ORF Transcript_20180/g.56206 Transcript_20180/m.56206 type:complete len:432 (+) Transcript_20180:22-1317(+)
MRQPRCAATMTECHIEQRAGLGEALPSLQRGCVYLDWNATTPIFPESSAAMLPYISSEFGNPSSSHAYGRTCKATLAEARQAVADMVGARAEEIYFTSSGTESDHWAIYGSVMAARAAWGFSERLPHVVTSAIEHPAVAAHLAHLAHQKLVTYTEVPVDGDGLVGAEDVLAAITPDTVLVSIMHSNNEIGSIQKIRHIASSVRESFPHVLVHTDAAQSVGKVELNVEDLGVHMMTIVGHKFGAPKGVAALFISSRVTSDKMCSFFYGGGQEFGRRAGTENVLLVAGMGAAAKVVQQELGAIKAHMAMLRDKLEARLAGALPKECVRINGPACAQGRLPNTLSISIRGLNSSTALANLADKLAASAGAACHSSGGADISGVLKAIGVPTDFAMGTLRLSCGRHTTVEDIDAAAELILKEAAAQGIHVSEAKS